MFQEQLHTGYSTLTRGKKNRKINKDLFAIIRDLEYNIGKLFLR